MGGSLSNHLVIGDMSWMCDKFEDAARRFNFVAHLGSQIYLIISSNIPFVFGLYHKFYINSHYSVRVYKILCACYSAGIMNCGYLFYNNIVTGVYYMPFKNLIFRRNLFVRSKLSYAFPSILGECCIGRHHFNNLDHLMNWVSGERPLELVINRTS
jgi:hypothetical protein